MVASNLGGVDYAQGWPLVHKHMLSICGSAFLFIRQLLHDFVMNMRSKCLSEINCLMQTQHEHTLKPG